jgi:hypothetical protein
MAYVSGKCKLSLWFHWCISWSITLFGDFFKCDQLWYCLVWHNLGIQHIICYYYGN